MPITTYTTTAEVRAVLGVSRTELPDTVILQSQWEMLLTLEFEDAALGILPLFSALPSAGLTAQQERFSQLVKLFASFALAKGFLASLPLFSVQSLTDGKAEFSRQDDVHKDVRDSVSGMYSNLRKRLIAAYLVLSPGAAVGSTTTAVFVAAVPLGTDPVTAAG